MSMEKVSKMIQTEELCPRCKLTKLWKIEPEFDDIFISTSMGCTYCNYREDREREVQMRDNEVTDEEYYSTLHKLGS